MAITSHPPRPPCIIRVVVRDDTDLDAAPVHDREGNHNDPHFRDWIKNTEWWALRNGCSLCMYPITYTDGRVAPR
jgi:hypothetical protein